MTVGLPAVELEHNLRLLAHHDIGGHPDVGEGMAMKLGPRGERYLYVAHVGAGLGVLGVVADKRPAGISVLEVTEPDRPQLVWQSQVAHVDVRANSLALRGDLLLVAQQVTRPGMKPAGMEIYDISDPAAPRSIGSFDASGEHSRGAHFVSFLDDQTAQLATGMPGFEPAHPKDDQFYVIVDLSTPDRPREVGRWWLPGQSATDGVSLARHPEPFDYGFRPHNVVAYSERPDRAYLGYIDGGIVILDVSNRSRPVMVSRLDYHPPFPGFTHTVVPLFERGLLVVTDEASGHSEDGGDWPKRIWLVDGRVETNPVIISSMPTPEGFDELRSVGGRIGAHNVHENEPEPGSARLTDTVVATWFSAGLRIYDIRDPFRPEEIAAFLPKTPEGQRGCRINDVFVDDRGVIYAGDRARGGLYVLEYTGTSPLT